MSYYRTVDEIYHERWSTHKLLRIRWLRESIRSFWPDGHPARLIHVAGTNGKGTVCRLLESGLREQGGCGTLTNPHLFDYAERYSLNGETLSHDRISQIWRHLIQPHSLERADRDERRALSFAEAGILLALHAFEQEGLDYGVVETGVGGRYSPSMAIDPALCILTNVGQDHTRTLGEALWQRALEKAGILRPGIPLLTAAHGEALDIIRGLAEEEGCPLHVLTQEKVLVYKQEWEKTAGPEPELVTHDWSNRALAGYAFEILGQALQVENQARIFKAVKSLPGRYWQVTEGLVADVAHNPDKLKALRELLDARCPGKPLRIVFGVSRNRPLKPMLEPLIDRATSVIFTGASYAGCVPEELKQEADDYWPALECSVIHDPVKALERAMKERQEDELVLLTGSAYTIDQALNPDRHLKTINAEYGRRGNDILSP